MLPSAEKTENLESNPEIFKIPIRTWICLNVFNSVSFSLSSRAAGSVSGSRRWPLGRRVNLWPPADDHHVDSVAARQRGPGQLAAIRAEVRQRHWDAAQPPAAEQGLQGPIRAAKSTRGQRSDTLPHWHWNFGLLVKNVSNFLIKPNFIAEAFWNTDWSISVRTTRTWE